MKNLPESLSNFKIIKKRNLAYIDKTRFIKEYEDLDVYVALLLRPRRFGKTMFTEILGYYYDNAGQELADTLFKDTWIASHSTELKNSYYVLKFDFSGIRTVGDAADTMDFFMNQITKGIYNFYIRYPEFIISDLIKSNPKATPADVNSFYGNRDFFTSPAKIIEHFLNDYSCRDTPLKLMVIIDEYDNFTNDILSRNPQEFMNIARKEGEIGAFYNILRNFNQSGDIERIFITGVLPVTMDTAVSGFVSVKLSDRPEVNCLAGFTDDEVLELLKETVDFDKCPHSPEALREVMKSRYDGYRFAAESENTVYNATLCINFISELRTLNYKIPKLRLTSANDVDYTKLSGYLNLMTERDQKELTASLLNKRPVECSLPVTVKISSSDTWLDMSQGISLLYHLGFLTLMSSDEVREYYGDPADGTFVKTANDYFSMLFERYALEKAHIPWDRIENQSRISGLALNNDLATVLSLLKSVAPSFVHTDVSREAEYQLCQAVYCSLFVNAADSFTLTREYYVRHNGVIVLRDGFDDADEGTFDNAPENDMAADEGELLLAADTKKGRADLVAENKDPRGPSYLMEFKYKRNARVSRKTEIAEREKLLAEARRQLLFYATDDHLKTIPNLHKYAILYVYGRFYFQEITD